MARGTLAVLYTLSALAHILLTLLGAVCFVYVCHSVLGVVGGLIAVFVMLGLASARCAAESEVIGMSGGWSK